MHRLGVPEAVGYSRRATGSSCTAGLMITTILLFVHGGNTNSRADDRYPEEQYSAIAVTNTSSTGQAVRL
ncbi:hypothetical protein HDV62DRAFT_369172 [Trichoderma sp. SZMC 28011]